jgi:hypothetical protein
MVAFGGGGPGFSTKNLYVVGFGGELTELPNVTSTPPAAAPLPLLSLKLSPSKAKVGKPVKVTATVSILGVPGARPAKGARVSLAGKSAKTDAKGRATLTVTLTKAGVRRAAASLAGFRGASAPVAAK